MSTLTQESFILSNFFHRPVHWNISGKQIAISLRHLLDGGSGSQDPAEHFLFLYEAVFDVCIRDKKYDPNLYALQSDEVARFCRTKMDLFLTQAKDEFMLNRNAYLDGWRMIWKICTRLIAAMSSIFAYLDRFYVKDCCRDDGCEDVESIATNGYLIFYKTVFRKHAIHAMDVILKAIERKRDEYENGLNEGSFQSNDELIYESIHAFHDLDNQIPQRLQNTLFLDGRPNAEELCSGKFVIYFINNSVREQIKYYANYAFPAEIKSMIAMYHGGKSDYNILDRFFYFRFVPETKRYYSTKAKVLINRRMSMSQYFKICQGIIHKEAHNMKKWCIRQTNDVVEGELYRIDRLEKLIQFNKGKQSRKDFAIDLILSFLYFSSEAHLNLLEREMKIVFDLYLKESSKQSVFDEILHMYHHFKTLSQAKSPVESCELRMQKMFKALIASNFNHICVNLIKIWSCSLKKCDAVDIEKKMDFIVFVYSLMNAFDQWTFYKRFRDSFERRSKSKLYRSSNTFLYYDKMIMDKLSR